MLPRPLHRVLEPPPHPVLAAVVAASTGEMALNIASYVDMLVRARPASMMPGEAVGRLTDAAGIPLAPPGQPEARRNRREAGGALVGYGMAFGTTLAYALLRRVGVRLPLPIAAVALGGGALLVSDSVASALGVTDPREWSAADWAADIGPHLAFNLAAASTLDLIG